MVFIIGFPKFEGKNAIVVVLNSPTSYAHLFALYYPFKANIVATTFIEIIEATRNPRDYSKL